MKTITGEYRNGSLVFYGEGLPGMERVAAQLRDIFNGYGVTACGFEISRLKGADRNPSYELGYWREP